MAVILNIETSTSVCSVALSKDGAVVFNRHNYDGQSHGTHLGVYVQEALEYTQNNDLTLEAVAISCGPGSYTGLRIGVSTAKGLCYAKDIPLIAINTLEVLACELLFDFNIDEEALLCPMIDARRMEVYAAIYDRALNAVKSVSADIIDETSYRNLLDKHKIIFFGDGAEKCKASLSHPNATFVADKHPLADYMIALSEKAFNAEQFVDVAYFEPFYLKEFVAITPKDKVLKQ
ncbi:MAG: tRNA (adenosine(37)-N6)-threonylcarbamoyltransferase complex dimerization subunit type 1 TsaB [Bacteroidales bacterium]|nr:tRNA (adenosine(37)-N6)-threonylcarbamoyltransferase complex dimerization subunit type 1 TsaB [Bacteroidales bacterium]